jgi:hypothetical protein
MKEGISQKAITYLILNFMASIVLTFFLMLLLAFINMDTDETEWKGKWLIFILAFLIFWFDLIIIRKMKIQSSRIIWISVIEIAFAQIILWYGITS